jgi:hypothetical protein
MDEYLKDKLNKKEILTYSRRNKVQVPPPPSTKEVPPPPPPLVHDLLPHPAPANEELCLNTDVPSMMGNMNMSIPVVEMCNIPSIRREVLKALKVQDEAKYPLAILILCIMGAKEKILPLFIFPWE